MSQLKEERGRVQGELQRAQEAATPASPLKKNSGLIPSKMSFGGVANTAIQ